jgi:hypothetical protein
VAYVVEAGVNSYGVLVGGDDFLPLPTASYQWREPYPAIPEPIQVSWLPGGLPVKANMLAHNVLQDFAVDDLALQVLTSSVDSDLWVFARLVMDDMHFYVIQATVILDVVDVRKSIASEYDWQDFAFPHIPESCDSVTNSQFFRVPNRGRECLPSLATA